MKKPTKNEINECQKDEDKFTRTHYRTLKTDIDKVIDYIDLVDKFKSSYFWTPPSNAASRRYYEERYSSSSTVNFFGNEIDLDFDVTCSCRNIYTKKSIDLKELKQELKRVQRILWTLKFDLYKHLILKIDLIVENSNSINHNDIIFEKDYYLKMTGKTLHKGQNNSNYRNGKLDKNDKTRLEILRAKRAA